MSLGDAQAAMTLNEAAEEATCDLCGGHEFRVRYPSRLEGELAAENFRITDNSYGVIGQIVECSGCRLVYAFPRPPGECIENFYADLIDPDYCREAEGRAASCRLMLDRLQKHCGTPGRLLDVGAATGIFLRLARDAGWDAMGVEPSHWAAKHARDEFGLDVRCDVFPTAQLDGQRFDAITMLDVIEHTDSPRRVLGAVRDSLNPGGILALVTPDVGSLVARLLGPRWWHYRVAHLYFFDRATLWRVLREAGFEVVGSHRYGWTFSAEYLASRLQVFPVPQTLAWLRRNSAGQWLLRRNVRVNFGDSFEIYARRR
jgi:2-polyprenyl-3-methyl-5-hydroxy-6-metoxy-1,4-benzoquinol methylase